MNNYQSTTTELDLPFFPGHVVRDTSMFGCRYLEITKVLGQGAYAVVYQVKDRSGRFYALKCLSKRGLSWEQLNLQREEAKLHKSLSHPNVVRLERYFENKDWLFLVLEYCSGSDLFTWITERHDRSQVKDIFRQILQAVSYCHSKGIFHRDLKPENFLITASGVVKLCDFGLCTTEHESTDFDCGSKPYMSYECREANTSFYSPRLADVWSLGIVLLTLLYRRTPWPDCCSRGFHRYLQDPLKFLKDFGCEAGLADFLSRRVFCRPSLRISAAEWLRQWGSTPLPVRRRPDTTVLRELLLRDDEDTDVDTPSTSLRTVVVSPPVPASMKIGDYPFENQDVDVDEEEEELIFALDVL